MIAAIDIGGTKVAVGLVDSQGKVLASRESATGSDCEYAHALDIIVNMLRDVERNAGLQLSGVGIGSRGRSIPSLEISVKLISSEMARQEFGKGSRTDFQCHGCLGKRWRRGRPRRSRMGSRQKQVAADLCHRGHRHRRRNCFRWKALPRRGRRSSRSRSSGASIRRAHFAPAVFGDAGRLWLRALPWSHGLKAQRLRIIRIAQG